MSRDYRMTFKRREVFGSLCIKDRLIDCFYLLVLVNPLRSTKCKYKID